MKRLSFVPLFAPLLVAAACALAACSKSASEKPDHDHGAHAGHVHRAPHGGVLVELGAHEFNVEFLLDRAAGTLTAWTLDAHAENFVRLPLAGFAAEATVAGGRTPLAFAPVGNAATGETAGDTSEFRAQSAALASAGAVSLLVPSLEIRGKKFAAIRAEFPAAKP